MNKNKWFLNGGRGSGRSLRLLCETYENKIADLEKENAELKAKIYGGGYDAVIAKKDADIILLEKQNSELKKQIEKMKCCGNCNGILDGGRRTEKCHRCIMDSKELSEWELAND